MVCMTRRHAVVLAQQISSVLEYVCFRPTTLNNSVLFAVDSASLSYLQQKSERYI